MPRRWLQGSAQGFNPGKPPPQAISKMLPVGTRTQDGSLCYISLSNVVAVGPWTSRQVLLRHRFTLRKVNVA